MASETTNNRFTSFYQKLKISSDKFSVVGNTCKAVFFLGLLLYLLSLVLFYHQNCPSSDFFSPFSLKNWSASTSPTIQKVAADNSSTNINHLLFGLIGSVKAWKHRRPYIESWWRPGITRGYLYLDTDLKLDLLPWSSSSPTYRVSEDLSKLLKETNHVAPIMVRMVHGIMEVFKERHEGVRWIVMGDDDSLFFVDNMVDVLAQYDHTKYYYIGGHSETIMSNFWFSFETGFGGAGFILSYPLAEALVKHIDNCFRRYPYLKSADQITMTCIADFGVSLTANKGIHQIDLRGDISGFLSAHPNSPILSLHHFDSIEPIFPNKSRGDSLKHLMKSAKVDQSRMFRQTICYHRQSNWSLSVSWGYSTHVYESLIPRSILKRPLQTFQAWVGGNPPLLMFDTRPLTSNPCEAPHVFFVDGVEKSSWDGKVITSYTRSSPRNLSSCSFTGNHSANFISKIIVSSPPTKFIESGRSECCDVVRVDRREVKVKLRSCGKHEIIV